MNIRTYLKSIFEEPSAGDPHGRFWENNTAAAAGHNAGPALKPRLAAVRSAPSREEFAAWRDHPVTQFVFAAYRAQIETCERSWLAQSWEGGTADQKTLDDLKARADTYAALEESDYEAFCDACGVEPEPVEQGAWAS
jgi:hypothetical protein